MRRVRASRPSPRIEQDRLLKWLGEQGLWDNPFERKDAKYEENISAYYVPIQNLHVDRLLKRQEGWIFLAKTGCGKTALRKMVAAKCYPEDLRSRTLALVFESETWRKIQRREPSSPPEAGEYAQMIVELARKQLSPYPRSRLILQSDLAKASESHPLELLYNFCELAQEHGFDRIICLVDEIDNAFPDDPPTAFAWIRPLLHPEIREYLTFRYFLPDTVYKHLSAETRQLRLSACEVSFIRWDRNSLIELLSERMRAFSSDRAAPYTSVGQLCEDRLARTIDQEIAQLAEGSPRAAISLASKLLHYHCQGHDIPARIRGSAWREAKNDWAEERSRVLSTAISFGGEKGFRIEGQCIRFSGHELRLIARHYALLRCLIEAAGAVCTFCDLAAAGWQSDDQDVSSKTIHEAVRRLKKQLQKQQVDGWTWICAVRGRGYCLQVPASRVNPTGVKSPPDEYSHYEYGLEEMKRRLQDSPAYKDALVYEAGLRDNIRKARRYGDTPQRESERSEVIDRLNALCLENLGLDFNTLCEKAWEAAQQGPDRTSAQIGRNPDETRA